MRTPLAPPTLQNWRLSDGYVLRGRVWPPTRAGAPCCVYLHGIQSHGAWYEWSASVLADSGMGVVLPDRRGSGMNGAARGDAPSIERWRMDLREVIAAALREFAPAHIDLVGLSWGAKLVIDHALRSPADVRRVLLVTPGLFPAVDVSFRERLRIARSLLVGGRSLHEIPLTDPALFTDRTEGMRFIVADALKLTHATARFLYHSSRLDRALRRASRASLAAPTTLLLAQRERIIDNAATLAWAKRVCATPPIVRQFDASHTLEFESDLSGFEAALREWAVGGR